MSDFAHDLVTYALVYLAIGSIVWMMLYGAGFVFEAKRHGKSDIAITLASAGIVCAWPIVACVYFAALVKRVSR